MTADSVVLYKNWKSPWEYQLLFVSYNNRKDGRNNCSLLYVGKSRWHALSWSPINKINQDKSEQNIEKGKSYVTEGTFKSHDLKKFGTLTRKKRLPHDGKKYGKEDTDLALKTLKDCQVETELNLSYVTKKKSKINWWKFQG